MNKVVIVDYGIGNVHSVAQAVLKISSKVEVNISNEKKVIRSSDRMILPGQGAITECMKLLKKNNLCEEIINFIKNKPLLGICVGLQMLFEKSEEDKFVQGLGIFTGNVVRLKFKKNILQKKKIKFKIPHIGWNTVIKNTEHPLWKGIKQNAYFYFAHSYYVKPINKSIIVGKTFYGKNFVSAVAKKNIFATQFHPEKSSYSGLQLYKNFLEWKP